MVGYRPELLPMTEEEEAKLHKEFEELEEEERHQGKQVVFDDETEEY